jgi:acetyl-CoA carboxylase carboxyl transferase subunit alpha
VIDAVVKEPVGGAHRNPEISIDALGDAVEIALRQIDADGLPGPALRHRRRERFLAMGG